MTHMKLMEKKFLNDRTLKKKASWSEQLPLPTSPPNTYTMTHPYTNT